MSALVPSRRITAVVVAALVAVTLGSVGARQTATPTVAVDSDDIGGVVTGPRGPEAGVFVIAETTMLPTRLIKSVVTDDQGRYLIPDLPQGTYDVWVRGYGLVDSQKVKATPGKTVALKAVAAPSARVAAEYYPAQVLAVAAATPSRERFPRHGPEWQRHRAQHQEPGRMGPQHRQHRRLHGLSSDGRQSDTRDSRSARQVSERIGSLGSANSVGPGRRGHERSLHAGRPRSRARDVGRLDRPDRERRVADRGAAAASRQRAQCRRDDVGLGGSEGVSARRDRIRQAQSRPSTRTDRSTAPSRRAPTTCRSSIRSNTRRRRSS